ncbi:site-specific integrase [Oxalobacteraceae bacterium OTU3REALA1]|nr:site-specific integrase [Oxalobacteraceae bacterium OTU3REALA1]
MHIKAPRLLINRFGVYYFRYKSDGVEKRISLRTKCSTTANIIALQLNLAIERKRAMSNPKLIDFDFGSLGRYEITLPNGVHIKTDGSQEDHSRAMEALENIGPLLQQMQPTQAFKQPAAPLIPPSEPLTQVVDEWLANCQSKNVPRTVVTKGYHIKDFLGLCFSHVESVDRWLAEKQNTPFLRERGLRTVEARKVRKEYKEANIEINAITRKMLTDYKSNLFRGDAAQTGKTIDNKLDSLKDFLDYAIKNGRYTASQDNPVQGLHIHTKKTRKATTKSFQPFTVQALKTLFEPETYLARMKEPDLFWGPLLGVYSGMRIGEATQIRVQDVYYSDNGVHYIHVYKSKTAGGIRNVPIAQALIDLGFLDYVEECKAAGAKRLFPHCKYINHSYYKNLSATLLEHQRERNIKAPQTSFHSFRVNVITELHNKNANAGKILKIVGHEDGSGNGQAVHWGYVRDLPDCKEIVDLLHWPIDLTALRYDGRFRNFVSDQKNWAADKEEAAEREKVEGQQRKKRNKKQEVRSPE